MTRLAAAVAAILAVAAAACLTAVAAWQALDERLADLEPETDPADLIPERWTA